MFGLICRRSKWKLSSPSSNPNKILVSASNSLGQIWFLNLIGTCKVWLQRSDFAKFNTTLIGSR